jgi:hypothetical protein
MMAGVHDTGTGDERGAERRDHYDECAPDFSLCIGDVQFGREVEREVKQSGKGDCDVSVFIRGILSRRPTAAVSRGEALEPVLQDVVVGLRADGNGLQYTRALVYFGLIDLAAAQSQHAQVRTEV